MPTITTLTPLQLYNRKRWSLTSFISLFSWVRFLLLQLKPQANIEAREVKYWFAHAQSGGLLSRYNNQWLMIRYGAVATTHKPTSCWLDFISIVNESSWQRRPSTIHYKSGGIDTDKWWLDESAIQWQRLYVKSQVVRVDANWLTR